MVAIRDRNDPLRLMGRRILLTVLALLVVSASWALWNVYRKERDADRRDKEAQMQLADLKERYTQLQNNLDTLRTERGMEEAVRGQYGVGRKGEGLIVIVEPPTPEPVQATSSTMQWFKDMLSYF